MKLDICKRWMGVADLEAVAQVENECYEEPWSVDDFRRCLRQRHCVGMVVHHAKEVVGYYVYEFHDNMLHVISIGVAPDWRRQGVGTFIVDALKAKLSPQGRSFIEMVVPESLLEAQLFLKAQHFRAVHVDRLFYADLQEDGFIFRYVHADVPECERRVLQNLAAR